MTGDRWSRWLTEERWANHRPALEAALNLVRDRVLALAALRPGERVLDLGSGTGLLGLKAAESVGRHGLVVCLDISRPALLDAADKAALGCEHFLVGDVLSCPLRDGCVDAVVIRSVLIYLKDKLAAAGQLARVLRPGGRVALHEPINRRMPIVVDMSAFADVAEAFERAREMSPLTDFDENDLEHAFHEAGFRSVHLEMDESRWPARGKEWAHGFRFGAPRGFSGYDMLLAAGVSRERADEFLAAGEARLGDRWTVMTCPVAYLLAVR